MDGEKDWEMLHRCGEGGVSEIEPEFCALDQETGVEGIGLGKNGRILFHHVELRSLWAIPQ